MNKADVLKSFVKPRIASYKKALKIQGCRPKSPEWRACVKSKRNELKAQFERIDPESLEYKGLAAECYKTMIASEKRKMVDVSSIPIIFGVCKTNKDTFAWISSQRRKHLRYQAPCEVRVEGYLKFKGIEFVPEQPFFIDNKIYFADFYVPCYDVIIEIDGATHSMDKDSLRDAAFARYGIRTIRVSNRLAKDPDNLATVLQSYGI